MKRLISLSAIACICALLSFATVANAKNTNKTNGTTSQSAKKKSGDPFVKFIKKLRKASEKKRAAKKALARKKARKTSTKRSSKKSRRKYKSGSYNNIIARHARANGVPVKLAKAVIRIESNFNPNARGGVGEIGLMQLRFATARGVGYRGSKRALYNPETNIKFGMKYLGKARRLAGGNLCRTILKYNAGHGAKRMNPISANYCRKVKRVLARS